MVAVVSGIVVVKEILSVWPATICLHYSFMTYALLEIQRYSRRHPYLTGCNVTPGLALASINQAKSGKVSSLCNDSIL